MRDAIENIINVDNNLLDKLDMSKYNEVLCVDMEYRKYFLNRSGSEHYRLLCYISTLFNNINILDIGTNRGYSAIALSYNEKNNVVSYDIEEYSSVNQIKKYDILSNIKFLLGNCLEKENLNNYKLILLDTAHDGKFENIVLSHLKNIKWSGMLLMDDILYFPALTEIWNNLTSEKYDLTRVGHISGTGMVIFNGENL